MYDKKKRKEDVLVKEKIISIIESMKIDVAPDSIEARVYAEVRNDTLDKVIREIKKIKEES